MAAYLRDLGPTCVQSLGCTVQAITTTTTGPTVVAGGLGDFLQADGLCNLQLALTATSLTAITAQVQESTTTNSNFADISGAYVTATTDGVTSVAFQRTKRYLKVRYVLSGTTAFAAAILTEQLKIV